MSSDLPLTVRDLRRRWKPAKQRLQALRPDHPTAIRVHRCCSWLHRVEEQGEHLLDDMALILRWIALNSLYGQWNEERREPAGDRGMLADFAYRIEGLDASGHVRQMLVHRQSLVLAIMEDQYLARHYWEEPSLERAQRTKKEAFNARRCFADERYGPLLWRLLDRIYLMRCQLVHGAATAGGALNRTSLRRCNLILSHTLPSILLVVMDHGEDIDWGPLCYPPHADPIM